MTFGSAGSIASEPMFKLSCLFHSERHVWPASLLCHTPPPADPTQIRSGCFGWQTMLVSLPPMFVGPMHLQRARAFDTGRSRLTRFLSSTSLCTGASRYGHALRARNHTLRLLWPESRGFDTRGFRSFFCGPGVIGTMLFPL